MERFDWKAVIKLNLKVFKTAGLWPKGSGGYRKDFYSAYAIFMIIFFGCFECVTKTWAVLTNFDDVEVVTGTGFLLMSESLAILKMFSLIRNIKPLKELIVTLDRDLFQPRNAEQIALISPNLTNYKIMHRSYVSAGVCCCLFWSLVPVVTNALKDYRLPFIASFPYNTKVSPWYEITYVYQAASIFYIAVANTNLDALIAAFSFYAAAQLDILCDNIKNLDPKNFLEDLVICVKHHREIVKFVDTYNRAFDWIVFMQFFTSAIVLGFTMFLLSTVAPFTSEFYSLACYGSTILLETFMYCWFGNEVHVKSNALFTVGFESKWLEASLAEQKDLIFFMMRSQRFIKVTALDLFDLSLETFLRIMKTSYSYFALVSRLNSKD